MSVWRNPGTGKWTAKFKFQGRQVKKEGFAGRDAALAWEVAEKKALKEKPAAPPTRTTLKDFANEYLNYSRDHHRHNSYRQKLFVFSLINAFFDKPYLQDITKPRITEYLSYQKNEPQPDGRPPRGPKAANRDRREINALFNWGMAQGLVDSNPCAGIEPFPEDTPPRYVPPLEDIDRVILAAQGQDRDMVVVTHETAGRLGEILRMTWEDVNFEHGVVRLWTRKRKGGSLHADPVPITPGVYEILRRRWKNRDTSTPYVFHKPDGSPWSSRHVMRLVPRLCKRAGVKVFGFHALRHSAAMIIADSAKGNLRRTQKWLRHKRPTTTDTYLASLDPGVRDVADAFNQAREKEALQEKGVRSRGTPDPTK